MREVPRVPSPPNRACERVCSVLGLLSRKVTLGGRPLVPFSRRICLSLFFLILSTPTSRVVSSPHPLFQIPAAPRRVGSRSRSRGVRSFGTRPLPGPRHQPLAVPRGWPATSLGSTLRRSCPRGAVLRPSRRQRCLPCACRLSAGRGRAVLRGSGNSLRHPEHRKQNPHPNSPGSRGALRAAALLPPPPPPPHPHPCSGSLWESQQPHPTPGRQRAWASAVRPPCAPGGGGGRAAAEALGGGSRKRSARAAGERGSGKSREMRLTPHLPLLPPLPAGGPVEWGRCR